MRNHLSKNSRLLCFAIVSACVFNVGVASAKTRVDAADYALAKNPVSEFSLKSTNYIEFSARPTSAFGHSYVRIGEKSRSGKLKAERVYGFYPVTTKANDVFDTPGVITRKRADLKSKSTVMYRLSVSRATYDQSLEFAEQSKKSWRRYDLLGKNCNHFVGQFAKHLGLSVPTDYDDLPENYVRSLAGQNHGRARASWRKINRSAG